MNIDNNIEKALHDINFIKNIIHKHEDNTQISFNGITLSANIFIQAVAFISSILFLLAELFSNYSMTDTLLLGNTFPELKIVGITLIGLTLVGLIGALYFILWRASQYNNEPVNQYIVRNFKYLTNMSFFSDLFIKFMTLSLVLLAQKAQWIAPLLLLFTADYLLQSRFFIISTKIAMLLGIVFIVGSLAMFFNNLSSLVYPLIAFSFVTGISLIRLIKRNILLKNNDSKF